MALRCRQLASERRARARWSACTITAPAAGPTAAPRRGPRPRLAGEEPEDGRAAARHRRHGRPAPPEPRHDPRDRGMPPDHRGLQDRSSRPGRRVAARRAVPCRTPAGPRPQPAVGVGRRDPEAAARRPPPTPADGRSAGTTNRRARGRAPCPRRGSTARRRRADAAIAGSRRRRRARRGASARSAAAASLLPPPRPACDRNALLDPITETPRGAPAPAGRRATPPPPRARRGSSGRSGTPGRRPSGGRGRAAA